jgi:hypothetical protein
MKRRNKSTHRSQVHNEGVIQYGGTIQGGQIAIGRESKASSIGNELTDSNALVVAFERLASKVEAHATELDNHDLVVAEIAKLREEITNKSPNKTALATILSKVAESVKNVATIAGAVETLQKVLHLAL